MAESRPRTGVPAFWLATLVFPFLLLAVLDAVVGRGPALPAQFQLDTALAVESAAETPEFLPVEGWRRVTLPGQIAPSDVRPSSGWFRLEFTPAAIGQEPWAVYFAEPYSNLAVFVNGVSIGASGPMSRPIPMYREPLLFTFPSSLLHAGPNRLEVRSLEADFRAALRSAVIGPRASLAPVYEFAHALDVTWMRTSAVVLCVLGILFAALWRLRRRETGFAWFALGLFAWAAHIQFQQAAQPPLMPEILWLHLGSIAIGVFAIATALFVNRHTGLRQPRVERALLAFGLGCATFMIVDTAVLGWRFRQFVPFVWMPGLLLVAIYGIVQLLRALRSRATFDLRILLAGGWMLLVVGVHDQLVQTGVLPWGPFYMNYTVGFALCAVAAVLLHRFALAFDSAERARDELDLRVREKSAELEVNLGRMKDLERERALSAERERILQDMHDGLGGHLVQALAIATSREPLRPLEEPLRDCLDELRLMVDSLEPADGDLASVLGSLRPRVSRRLALAGVAMRWQIDDLPAMSDLGPRAVLDVARVVQEAITNAIKHSGCRAITVRARVAPGSEAIDGPAGLDGVEAIEGSARIEIDVEDDGCGLQDAHGHGHGHGLASMRRRAAALGGRLEIAAVDPGTRVTLRLPLVRGTRSAQARQSPEQGQPDTVLPAQA